MRFWSLCLLRSLLGKSFKDLIVLEEQARVVDFIEQSTAACMEPSKETLPLCSRVSLRDAAGIRVAADLYHLAIPDLFGAEKPYHLISFKEDPESRGQPEASEDSVPLELLWKPPCQDDKASSRSSGSSVAACAELREMTLLVATDTELQDVQEAHLRFRRNSSSDVAAALHSSMPSLRKLLQPTDWETMRAYMQAFMHGNLGQSMRKLTLKLPDESRVVADEAMLKPVGHPSKVWLHLTGLRPMKSRRLRTLDKISEAPQLFKPRSARAAERR